MSDPIWAIALVAMSAIWALAWVATTYFKYGTPFEGDEREEEE